MTLYIELDDVLCNLEAGIAESLQIEPQEIRYSKTGEIENITSKELESLLSQKPAKFWEELDTTEDFISIKQVLSNFDFTTIKLLTRPYNISGCTKGKQAWVAKHIPEFELLFTRSKHVFSNQKSALLDVRPGAVQAFKRFGGTGVLIPKPWQKGFRDVNLEQHLTEKFQAVLASLKGGSKEVAHITVASVQ